MRLPFSSGCVKRPGMDTGARMKRPLGKIRGGGARSGWTTAALFTDDPLEGFRHAEEDLVKAGLLRNLRNFWWFEPCQGESATIREYCAGRVTGKDASTLHDRHPVTVFSNQGHVVGKNDQGMAIS